MQVFDLDDLEPVNIQIDESDKNSSMNLGSGIELLMNTKKISNSSKRNPHLGEVGEIEDEINKLYTNKPSETNTLSGFASNLFNFSSNESDVKKINTTNNSNLGSATSTTVSGINKSQDGFTKMNDIPVEFSKYNVMTDREKSMKKRKMLRDLEKDRNSHHHCNQDTPYEDVEDEYNTYVEDKRKNASIQFQRMWFMTMINSMEALNGTFNPFNVSLDGLSEVINDDLDAYDETFGELYVKYNGLKLSPEISLLFRVGLSVGMIVYTNNQFNSMAPDTANILRQNPNLMKEFTKTATKMATEANPFFNDFTSSTNQNDDYGPPPKPIQTKLPLPSERPMPKNSSRPDIELGRGSMFHEQGIDLTRDRENIQEDNYFPPPPSLQQQQSKSQIKQSQSQSQSQSNQRYEMKGPKDIDFSDFLTGIKTKPIQEKIKENENENENDSLISITSMKDMLNQSKNSKRPNRRKISEKNTISLDI